MSPSRRLAFAAGAVGALLLAPAPLRAQATPAAATAAPAAADSLAYPRQFVNWVLTFQGDSAFAHAGPMLRESMKTAEGVNQMAGRIVTRFGAHEATDAEVQFDEGPLKVYIAAMRFSQTPELAGWVVVYSPATKVVERAMFTSLANVKGRYPQAKLP